MEVKCTPKKELFSNSENGYRVLSCDPIGNTSIDLNKYGNFTLSGTNLSGLKVGQEASIEVEIDEKSKYPASYIMTGYMGIKADGEEITVAPEYEIEILERFMTKTQAKNVNDAYPDFVFKILNGKEDEINVKNIYNVGDVRMQEYTEKIKSNCQNILLYPEAYCAGITGPNDMKALRAAYNNPDELKEALHSNPYHVYIDIVGFSFAKADRLTMAKYPEFADSVIRCKYACISVLRENENESGDTRLEANVLAMVVKDMLKEDKNCIEHVKQVVLDSDAIYYDKATKYASIRSTYEDEKTIAENIKERLDNPKATPMKWEKYTKVGDFTLTDEQTEILKVIQFNSIAFLTAPAGGGKSSSMKAVIRMLEGNGYGYTMLCPTGTAAKVLTKATGRRAYTIHMFLAKEMMCEDFLILEESSMLSAELLARLLRSIRSDVKIIFICDPSQLPSIGCGNVVHDILDARIVPTVNLTKIFRYNSSGLITVATDTRNGSSDSYQNAYTDYHYVEADGNSVKKVCEAYAEANGKGYSKDDILILTPYNKTAEGTYAINDEIQKRFNGADFLPIEITVDTHKIKFKPNDRVINKKNNYHIPVLEYDEKNYTLHDTGREIFVANGTIGNVIEYYQDEGVDCLAIQFEEGIGQFKGSDISNLRLGYAVTVHASQGNQARAVITLFDKIHAKMCQRNILYVAFTRSQEELWVIGDSETIEDGVKIEATKLRDTWLGDMLKEEK